MLATIPNILNATHLNIHTNGLVNKPLAIWPQKLD